MTATPHRGGTFLRRWRSVLAAALVAGAFQVSHDLGRAEGIAWPCVAYSVLVVLLEVGALTVVFEGAISRRVPSLATFALTTALAIALGVASAYAGLSLQERLGIDLVGIDNATASRVASVGVVDGLLALGLFAAVVVLPFAVKDANARAVEADQLRTKAELARLRSALQPHFLLNTLQTIAGLVNEDKDEARELIGALGELLRDSLDNEQAEEMQPLEREIEWLRRYASILEIRHGGMLRFEWAVANETRATAIPRLLLQPLLENAVTHGALRRRDGGVCRLSTTLLEDGRVRCVIEDNGPGLSPAPVRPGALGVSLVTRRLALHYGTTAIFRLDSAGGMTRATVELPKERAS